MRLKRLRGMAVVDPTTAHKIGTVLDFQIDPAAGRLAAIDVGSAEGDAQRIGADRIHRVGRDAVILTRTDSPPLPASTDERWLDESSLVGLEVIGVDGNRIGHLSDAVFDQDSLAIEFYVLRQGIAQRLTGRGGRILPNTIRTCSRELMLLSVAQPNELPSVAAELEPPGPPLALKVDDRLPSPRLDQAADSEPVVARRR
jgi:sporulation protein YlmC with PRC-barrel domain